MVSIRAHFDGKVFVPDEPVLLPPDSAVRLLVAPDVDGRRPLLELARALEGLPDDPDWLSDGAAEIDHYLYGTPKRNDGESALAQDWLRPEEDEACKSL